MALNFYIVGRQVKESRIKRKMSQASLAEQIDMSVSYISLIETAKKQASLEALVRIADALGTTVDHLLNGNQANDIFEYKMDILQLFEGCSSYEKRLILEIAYAIKISLLKNRNIL